MNDERLFGQIRILSEGEVEQIHRGATRTLSCVGVVLEDPASREILRPVGATVKGDRVYLPESLVESTLGSGPERIVLGTLVDLEVI